MDDPCVLIDWRLLAGTRRRDDVIPDSESTSADKRRVTDDDEVVTDDDEVVTDSKGITANQAAVLPPAPAPAPGGRRHRTLASQDSAGARRASPRLPGAGGAGTPGAGAAPRARPAGASALVRDGPGTKRCTGTRGNSVQTIPHGSA